MVRLEELLGVPGIVMNQRSGVEVAVIAKGGLPQVLSVTDQRRDEIHAILVEELVGAENWAVVGIVSREQLRVVLLDESIGVECDVIGADCERVRKTHRVSHELWVAAHYKFEELIAVAGNVESFVAEFSGNLPDNQENSMILGYRGYLRISWSYLKDG
jgi:hypothetical protein